MAATFSSTFSDTKGDRAGQGYRTRLFSVAVGADNDTLATGIKGIREVWWLGDTTSDAATVSISDATTGTIKFDTGGAVNGKILVRSKG